ncbi:glycosyltransferase [Algoriphagus aquimarinus]|nr:glycosyltransferase [Algoriphagus aquimarinus]
MIDYLIVTHIPVFYKINLYNEISKERKIFVLFVSDNTGQKRSIDFTGLHNAVFDYECINYGNFEHRNKIKSIFKLVNKIRLLSFKKIIISGWDLPEFWVSVFMVKKRKNCLALESTINESIISGVKGYIKKLFLNRISHVFASGKMHAKLIHNLNYRGKVSLTYGVGIINKPLLNKKVYKEFHKRFVFIGRLSPEKNLSDTILVFNNQPDIELQIYGSGPQENYLKSIAGNNISFMGSIANSQLQGVFNNVDFLLLLSKSETWGLVVEEALYFGVPVILSDTCGASELINDGVNGFILPINNLKDKLNSLLIDFMEDSESFNLSIDKNFIDEKDETQVKVYFLKN